MIDYKGIWIPAEIIEDHNLNLQEKLLYSLILFMCRNNKDCYCSNTTISEIFSIPINSASRLILSLKSKGYINIKMQYFENSKKIQARIIEPLQHFNIHKMEYTSIHKIDDINIHKNDEVIKYNKNNNKIKKYENEPSYSKAELEMLYDN